MQKQSFAEVIVVDYGCEEGTSEWVRANCPRTTVLGVSDDPSFSASRARNIGAQRAKGRFLLFVDSDVFLEEDLGSWIVNHARTDQFYTVRDRRQSDLCGTVICGKAQFDRIGGYDEVFRGWGEEDNDLYERFSTSGLTSNFLPDHALRSIQHGDELRMLGKQDPSGYTNRRQAIVLGRMYRIIKMALLKNEWVTRRDH